MFDLFMGVVAMPLAGAGFGFCLGMLFCQSRMKKKMKAKIKEIDAGLPDLEKHDGDPYKAPEQEAGKTPYQCLAAFLLYNLWH